ncbi:MAG: hypothetical protein ABI947_08650, partial [Chloroflexota bacterium]
MQINSIPESSIIIDHDAYFLENGFELNWYRRAPNGGWKTLISSVSMCWGCFGNHSYVSGQCWGVLCQCCGGTGWEGKDMEFCAGHPLSSKSAACIDSQLPQTAFLQLLNTGLSDLDALQKDEVNTITPALVRGKTAKIEIITKNNLVTRHLPTTRMKVRQSA